MARTNRQPAAVYTHEGARAQTVGALAELRRSVLTCMLWEPTFYESGNEITQRIASLVPQVKPEEVVGLAAAARSDMQLRHVPLFLLRELARYGNGSQVAMGLVHCIQRADELAEFLAMYWKDGRCPIAAGVKRGLARAFRYFDAYQFAKYNRDGKVKLRDVMFMVHPNPNLTDRPIPATAALSCQQLALAFRNLADKTLESPDTWEVELSAGKDKKETFERLLKEKKLGGMATIRNLRKMTEVGVDPELIRERLRAGIARALPFRFIAAARYAPQYEPELEEAMLKSTDELPTLAGKTGILIDVSGSMDAKLSDRSDLTRLDAACGVAIHVREKCPEAHVATFSEAVVAVPSRRGFALRDAIWASQEHSATYLRQALTALERDPDVRVAAWKNLERIIVITDEQAHDGIRSCWTPKGYVVNVAPYKNGLSYGNGWTHIDGFSERVIDYMREVESDAD